MIDQSHARTHTRVLAPDVTFRPADRDAGRAMPWVLADGDDEVIAAFTLSQIALGPYRSALLGLLHDDPPQL